MDIKTQHSVRRLFVFLLSFASVTFTVDAQTTIEDSPKLQNPINVAYVKKHLRKAQPRLVFNRDIEKRLKQQLKIDPVIRNMYKAIQRDAAAIPGEPLLERKQIGRRLLSVSREMLRRVNMLGMVYRIEKDPAILQRIND